MTLFRGTKVNKAYLYLCSFPVSSSWSTGSVTFLSVLFPVSIPYYSCGCQQWIGNTNHGLGNTERVYREFCWILWELFLAQWPPTLPDGTTVMGLTSLQSNMKPSMYPTTIPWAGFKLSTKGRSRVNWSQALHDLTCRILWSETRA